MRLPSRLRILLGEVEVGTLDRLDGDRTEFRLLRSYIDLRPRPVLGQRFEDDPLSPRRARMRVPRWFSNLLPEARLRELVVRKAGVDPEREFFILWLLGEDLPGNVRAVPDFETAPPAQPGDDAWPASGPDTHFEGPLKASIAGVQLKFSMLREGRGLTLPASGLGGDWIVKLPDNRWGGVPENEFVTMTWARKSGLDVPEFELRPVAELRGLPVEAESLPGNAFAIRRFDRTPEKGRVHIEDFAQVLDLFPTHKEKYSKANYETLGNVILRVAGEAEFEKYVRRLVFVIASANGDAHVKNWSLIYPDGYRAELSPAYDQVSTIEFIEHDTLGLNLAGNKKWEAISEGSFLAMARRLGVDEVPVQKIVRDQVERTRSALTEVVELPEMSRVLRQRLEAHWQRVPLLRGA